MSESKERGEGGMAARLTDRQKKKIVADYIQLGSYNAAAKVNGVSPNTVKKLVQGNAEIAELCQRKKEENAADIRDYMDRQRGDVCQVLGICLDELKKPERYQKTPPQQIATTMAILIDKYAAAGGGPKDETEEDGLSRSLRELAERIDDEEG